jgi:hypothetical protein
MKDIDFVLGNNFYNTIDPVSGTIQGVGMGIQGLGSIATAFKKDELEKRVVLACGRKNPFWGKDKKAKYTECSGRIEAEYRASIQRQLDIEGAKAQAEIEKAKSLQGNQGSSNTPIFIGIGAVVVIGLVIFLMRK